VADEAAQHGLEQQPVGEDLPDVDTFAGIEEFLAREVRRYGRSVERPVRIELGETISEQPPAINNTSSILDVALWSLKMRWWVSGATDEQDHIDPDVRMFVRYHSPETTLKLDDSVGVQKGMFGVVNAYSSRRLRGRNNVVIAHEFLHTLGATDKYDRSNGMPIAPHRRGRRNNTGESRPRHYRPLDRTGNSPG
jgi:hypothetical protein